MMIVVVSGGTINYFRPLPAAATTETQLNPEIGTVSLAWPSDGATAAIGAVGYGVLTNDGNDRLPTASIAKLITALTILKAKPLLLGQSGPTLTLTNRDVDLYNSYVVQDGSVVNVVAGEQLSEYQALLAMLLPSANNIADSLALWAYGSLSSYADNANQLIQALGVHDTTVGSDASGLSPTTMSTPADLVSLGIAALQNPVLAQIVAQPNANLPVVGTVQNVNFLLGKDGINGIKTGNSDQANGCYLFSAPYSVSGHTITIVGAIMNAPTLANALNDALPLLSSTERGFVTRTPVLAGQRFGDIKTQWGAQATIIAAGKVSLLAWQGAELTPHRSVEAIRQAHPAGTIVGTIVLSSGSYESGTTLVLKQALPPPNVWWRLTRHFL